MSDLCDSSWLSSLREVAIVLFKGRDCSQNIPSQVTAHGIREQLCLVVADADVSGANSSRKGHSNHEVVQLTETGSATASNDDIELAQTGGISIRRGGSDRTTLTNLDWSRLLLRSQATIHMAWAEDRAPVGTDPSAVPGAKIGDWGDRSVAPLFSSPRLAPRR